jgi:adenine phosphoribosyltransferase
MDKSIESCCSKVYNRFDKEGKQMDLKAKLRHVMDFPKKGVDFIDITTVLQDAKALAQCVDSMKEKAMELGDFDMIVGPESRGFIFGAPIAYALGKGFVPIRKKGKLPYKTISEEYQLEYGTDTLEIHEDAIQPGQNVVIIDDLLSTASLKSNFFFSPSAFFPFSRKIFDFIPLISVLINEILRLYFKSPPNVKKDNKILSLPLSLSY